MKRTITIFVLIIGLIVSTIAPAAAAGVGRIDTAALQTDGNDVRALDRCVVGNHVLTAIAGDFTHAWNSTHRWAVNRLFLADRTRHVVMWPGLAVTGGYVDSVRCVPRTATSALLVFAGDFTDVAGRARRHVAAYWITLHSGLHYSLASFTLPLTNRVESLTTGAGLLYIPTGWGVTAINLRTGRVAWHQHTDCNTNAVFYWSQRLYVGGAFLGIGYPGQRGYFQQYGLAALVAATGAPIRSFHPGHLPMNQTDCHHPPTSDHSAYSGDQPKSFGYVPGRGLLFGGAGKSNLAGLVTPAGRWIWLRHLIGDGQAAAYLGNGYAALCHHRSPGDAASRTWEWDGVVAVVHVQNGYSIHASTDGIDDRYHPDAANRDGGNNGCEAALVDNHQLVLGGAMVIDRSKFDQVAIP